jgi:hypothetical protein
MRGRLPWTPGIAPQMIFECTGCRLSQKRRAGYVQLRWLLPHRFGEGPASHKSLPNFTRARRPPPPGTPQPIAEPRAIYLKNEYPTKITLKSAPGLIVPR